MVSWYIAISLLILYVVSLFNGLIRSKNRVEFAFSGIDSILKKRLDLIPALIAVVKEYMKYEKKTLEHLTDLRGAGKHDVIQTDLEITKQLSAFLANAEGYPDLKSSNNFMQLQLAISEVEEQLSAARRTYNAHVLVFNNKIESIPSKFVAAVLKYKPLPMYISR